MRSIVFINSLGFKTETIRALSMMAFYGKKDLCRMASHELNKVGTNDLLLVYYLNDDRNRNLAGTLQVIDITECNIKIQIEEYKAEFTTDLIQFMIFCYNEYGTRSDLHNFEIINDDGK